MTTCMEEFLTTVEGTKMYIHCDLKLNHKGKHQATISYDIEWD